MKVRLEIIKGERRTILEVNENKKRKEFYFYNIMT